nr:hypothetical protein [Cobetia sp. Dlab-2-U]
MAVTEFIKMLHQSGELNALAVPRHSEVTGADIRAPTPFWLANAPLTDRAYNVVRAFEAGWGGVVRKTLGKYAAAVNSQQ